MANAIRLRDLRSLGKYDREQAIEALLGEAISPVNGQAMAIKARIQGFESRYEMTSAQLVDRLRRNSCMETAEISEWLFWLHLRDLSGGK